jgi:hypothetical protein
MKINKKWPIHSLFLAAILLLFTQGCSNLLDGKNSGGNSSVESIPKTEAKTVVAFDQKLSQIENQETAEDAVNYFADYAMSNRVKRTYTPKQKSSTLVAASIKSTSPIDSSLLNSFATIEAKARGKSNNSHIAQSLSVQSLEEENELITIAKLTSVVNQLKVAEEVSGFSKEEIRNNQRIIRQNIPHLASTDSELMTPLEASVIMYYIVTGDDGSKPQGSTPLTADNEDIQKFMVMLTE